MVGYDYEGGAVYGHPVSAVGVYERISPEDIGQGQHQRVREWAVWKSGWSYCGGDYDSAGCAEDEDDVGEGENGYGAAAEANIAR